MLLAQKLNRFSNDQYKTCKLSLHLQKRKSKSFTSQTFILKMRSKCIHFGRAILENISASQWGCTPRVTTTQGLLCIGQPGLFLPFLLSGAWPTYAYFGVFLCFPHVQVDADESVNAA